VQQGIKQTTNNLKQNIPVQADPLVRKYFWKKKFRKCKKYNGQHNKLEQRTTRCDRSEI